MSSRYYHYFRLVTQERNYLFDSDSNEDFSLSSALHAVFQQGESQALVLKEKQHVLDSIQATLTEKVKSHEAVAHNIKLKERQISGITCEVEHIHIRIKAQLIEIHAILMENRNLQHTIEEHLEKSQCLLAEYNTYRNKIESYKANVSEMENQSPIHKELMEKRKESKRLRKFREQLSIDLQNPEGNAVQRAQREIDQFTTKILFSKELVGEKMVLLEKEKQVNLQLRKEKEIHNRRCEAIVKRLRCQLNKAQSSHRQLNSEISLMEKEVEHLKSQL
ncbi:coiled-coil domain-containing protein 122 [Salminus brasiliensis]|uniref:coiled-coil domain-containing protein 122 n=1 Tax=Salminus brasiliensis TaxID=930266 RepID=UPI003B83362A